MKKFLYSILAALLICQLCACAKKLPDLDAKYYPQCYYPVKQLNEEERHNPEAKSGMTGALLGAIGGAIIAGITSGSIRSAAIGAVAGGVAGAVTGSLSAYLNKIDNQDKRLEEYGKYLDKNIKNWNIQRASVERSVQCYLAQTDKLKQDYDNGRLIAPAVRERAEEIHAGLVNVSLYWQRSTENMNAAIDEGEKYFEDESNPDKIDPYIIPQSQKSLHAKNEEKHRGVKENNDRTNIMLKDAENAVNTLLRETGA